MSFLISSWTALFTAGGQDVITDGQKDLTQIILIDATRQQVMYENDNKACMQDMYEMFLLYTGLSVFCF